MACTSPQTRRTRIVCISDTHCQTPKLPKGDVLIHAGDLTNQGSYSELKKTVEWLKKADFEAKIVVAGNHDITLDAEFYHQHGNSWRWPRPQDPDQCRRLLTESESITYLENEAATIYLNSPNGPHTCFKVFGSPCTPKKWNWAFQYEAQEAKNLWDAIPTDADIVITHTPPQGHCDAATKDDRSGCLVLLQALHRVRPMLAVCGHIHEARGVERVRWNDSPHSTETECLVEDDEAWKDPGAGNKKQSLVDLTARGGQLLGNCSSLSLSPTRPIIRGDEREEGGRFGGQPDESSLEGRQPDVHVLNSTSRLKEGVHSEAGTRAKAVQLGGAIINRQGRIDSDIGCDIGSSYLPDEADVESVERTTRARRETVIINAALLGPRISGVSKSFNKPIVVDVDLPVWRDE